MVSRPILLAYVLSISALELGVAALCGSPDAGVLMASAALALCVFGLLGLLRDASARTMSLAMALIPLAQGLWLVGHPLGLGLAVAVLWAVDVRARQRDTVLNPGHGGAIYGLFIVAAGLMGRLALPAADPHWSNGDLPKPFPDVVLITVDCLREDESRSMDLYRVLAEHGVAYQAQASSPHVLPSLLSIHTGLQPGRARDAEDVATLAQGMSALGFDTAATVHLPTQMKSLGRGFESFVLETAETRATPTPLAAGLGMWLGVLSSPPTGAAKQLADVERLASWRRAHPLFAWVHLQQPHMPGPSSKAEYPDEVAAADRALGDVLDALTPGKHGRVVVFAAAHGEAFGEHDDWGHGHTLHQELLSVPLVMQGLAGLRRGHAGQIDIAPTLLAAFGGDVGDLDGRDLRGPAMGTPYRSQNIQPGQANQRSVRVEQQKLIGVGEQRLRFDLGQDPTEVTPFPDDQRMEPMLP